MANTAHKEPTSLDNGRSHADDKPQEERDVFDAARQTVIIPSEAARRDDLPGLRSIQQASDRILELAGEILDPALVARQQEMGGLR